MDVTNDATIDNSVSRVLEWISDSKALIPRYFHALINNAGVGSFGLVDWLDMSSYRRDMEGMIVML